MVNLMIEEVPIPETSFAGNYEVNGQCPTIIVLKSTTVAKVHLSYSWYFFFLIQLYIIIINDYFHI